VAPHREVGTLRRHKLVNAIESLAERLCSQHRMGLEGGGDSQGGRTGDCPLCESDQEDLRNADAQRARRQAQLLECQSAVQGRIRAGERELGDFQQALDSLKEVVIDPQWEDGGEEEDWDKEEECLNEEVGEVRRDSYQIIPTKDHNRQMANAEKKCVGGVTKLSIKGGTVQPTHGQDHLPPSHGQD
ncbi:hypothetical protein MATL_G00003800, partial [Megalops atlanticus]